jgi:hypothetical protein
MDLEVTYEKLDAKEKQKAKDVGLLQKKYEVIRGELGQTKKKAVRGDSNKLTDLKAKNIKL